VFVDRRREHALLGSALAEAASSGRLAVFVTGEAGIGKTRLVSEFAKEAHATGTVVLGGRCDDGLALPYQPFVEALEQLVEHTSDEALRRHVADYGDSVARLLPAMASRLFEGRPVAQEASEAERYVLFRAIEGLLAGACADTPTLLVLEDLHWADLPTLKLLRRLLTSPRRPALMLVATGRAMELEEDHALRELMADLHREPHVLRLDLDGLQSDDVLELLRGIASGAPETPDRRLAQTLAVSTHGNPFFITELVRTLSATGRPSGDGEEERSAGGLSIGPGSPASITETLARRLRRMGEDVRRCLRVAAVVGDEFDLDLVSEVGKLDSAVDAVDLAVQNAVLIEVPGRPGRFRFAHALMQSYIYGELGPARRAELHRRVGLALEARSGTRARVAELARHWVAAGEADPRRALQYAVLAGEDALTKLAPDEARRWYEVALEISGWRHDAPDSERCDLLIRRGEAERQAGDRGFRETLLEAAAIAQRIGDQDSLVRAAVANTRGMQSETGIVDAARIATLDAALEVVGDHDSAQRARLLAIQAAELAYSGEWDRRLQLSDAALATARRLDDPAALSTVLNLRFATLLAPETHEDRYANTLEAVAVAEQLRDPVARFYAYHWRAFASIEAGDIDAARMWVAREREVADRFRQPTALWLARADGANLAIIAGELETADQLAADALEAGRRSEPDALACYAAQQSSIAFESGHLRELVPMLEQAVHDNPGVPGFRATLALALSADSRAEHARLLLDADAASGFSDLPRDVTWLAAACIYAQVASALAHADAARSLYSMLDPWREQIAFPAFGVWGPVKLHLGTLAITLRDTAAAERHLSAAMRTAQLARAPLWQARAARQVELMAGIGP
jgi:predicted ATPase